MATMIFSRGRNSQALVACSTGLGYDSELKRYDGSLDLSGITVSFR